MPIHAPAPKQKKQRRLQRQSPAHLERQCAVDLPKRDSQTACDQHKDHEPAPIDMDLDAEDFSQPETIHSSTPKTDKHYYKA
jgi:hypothetical protein